MQSKKQKMKSKSEKYYRFKEICKKIMKQKPKEIDPDEKFFEDDPLAVNEKDVGRVKKNQTHVSGKSIIDDLH